jgi:hypothetical protein
MPRPPASRLSTKPTVSADVRAPKTYMVNLVLNEQMKSYALRHRYTLASCVDAAFREFLAKHGP